MTRPFHFHSIHVEYQHVEHRVGRDGPLEAEVPIQLQGE
jgi:hypothetical protein